MNYLPIRRARLNQPNGEGIDWSNPITRGLKVAWMPAYQKNFANNRVLTPTTGSIVQKLTSRGVGFDLSGSNKVEYWATPEEALVGLNEATMICIGKVVKPTGTSDTGNHFMFDLSAGYNQGYNSIAASGYASEKAWQCSFYYASYAGTVTYYSPPFFVEGMEYSLAQTFKRNATACAYANGNLVSTKATLDYPLGRLQDGLYIGNTLNGIHAVLMNLAWDRELSPAEIKSIHNDPFQVFL